MSRLPTAARLALLAIVSVIVAGCFDAPSASVVASPTPAPEATPVTTTYDLGASVWYEGLVVHLDRAVAILDDRGGPVIVDVRVDNPSVDPSELAATIYLVVGDERVEPTRDSELQPIAEGGSVEGRMTYELQGVTSVDAAAIEIGDAPSHIGRVPLTAAGGEPVSLEPRTFDLDAAGAVGDLKVTLRSGLVRWDLPDWAEELDADKQVVILTYDATFIGSFTGGFAFTDENVALRLPDGTEVGPRPDGHSQSVELIGAGRTKSDLFTRFEIPAGVTGDVEFLVIDEGTSKAIPLAIPG